MAEPTIFPEVPTIPRVVLNPNKFKTHNSIFIFKSSHSHSLANLPINPLFNSSENLLKKDKTYNSSSDIMASVRNDVIGEDFVFQGPFGPRKCLYMDQTASGRSLKSIEDFIQENVLPIYGNTHTTTSYFGSQISAYRDESRKIIKESCGAGPEDALIFCGSGATAAVHKLVHSIRSLGDAPPIVFIGPFEHHSNILPWKESARKVISIPEDPYGRVNLKYLEKMLKKVKSKRSYRKSTVLGVFSAASNVTGALTDDVAVTALMHKYDALAFWDYAAAAPHVQICMNPQTGDEVLDQFAKKDALFFSGHKFMGGPQTTGILLAKKRVFRNPVPHGGGGGTVLFVTKQRHQYLEDISEKEEGGTPEIVGSIRLGLVFHLKQTIGIIDIIEKEAYYTRKALEAWGNIPEIMILGDNESPRVPIVSLMIKHPKSGYFLHHDFVTAVINDMFGIQIRGGCMCAGPYAQHLLGIDEKLAMAYEKILSEPRKPVSYFQKPSYDMIFKPGFVRISLPFHSTEEEIDFVIEVVKFVALCGWELLPYYKFNADAGTFRCAYAPSNELMRDPISSFSLQYSGLRISNNNHLSHKECLKFAQNCCDNMIEAVGKQPSFDDDSKEFTPERTPYRWFMLPSDAFTLMKNPNLNIQSLYPFHPKNYQSQGHQDEDVFTPQLSCGSIPYQITSFWMNNNNRLPQPQIKGLNTNSQNATERSRWLAGVFKTARSNLREVKLAPDGPVKNKGWDNAYDSDACNVNSRSSSSSGFHSDYKE